MAGKKGRSGGPRENSGGARPGAGRPPKEPVLNMSELLLTSDPQKFLQGVMNDQETDIKLRVDAAKALMPYQYPKKAGGIKDQKQAAAERVVGAGKFGPGQAPMRLVKGGRG